jgi:hypothetical protein
VIPWCGRFETISVLRLHVSRPMLRIAALAAASVVAACGGPVNTVPVSSTSPNAIFTSATSSSVTLPTLTNAGATVTGTLPSANAIAAVSESISASVPNGVSALAVSRAAASTRALQALGHDSRHG